MDFLQDDGLVMSVDRPGLVLDVIELRLLESPMSPAAFKLQPLLLQRRSQAQYRQYVEIQGGMAATVTTEKSKTKSYQKQTEKPGKRHREEGPKAPAKKFKREHKPFSKERPVNSNMRKETGATIKEEKAPEYHATDPEKAPLTVFASNLPQSITEYEVRKVFGGCGTINEVRIVRKNVGDKMNIFAYVEFGTTDDVKLALLKDRTPIDVPGAKYPRTMFVSPFRPKADSKSIFISNLPEGMTKELLEERFSKVSMFDWNSALTSFLG